MGYVYVLELEGNHWYVGFSDDLCTRIAQHFLHRGSVWTQLHRPLRVHSIIEGGPEMENPVTIATMAERGWRRVRGGSWSQQELGSMPFPIARAFSIDSHPVAGQTPRQAPRSYDFREHCLQVDEVRGEWRVALGCVNG